jgi:hypothetical protein
MTDRDESLSCRPYAGEAARGEELGLEFETEGGAHRRGEGRVHGADELA